MTSLARFHRFLRVPFKTREDNSPRTKGDPVAAGRANRGNEPDPGEERALAAVRAASQVAMRPVGTTAVDSTVSDFNANAADQGGDGGDKAPVGGVEMVGDREGAEEFYGGEAEVSSQCCGGLSPTTIVYMSAFVSSLTSVLLGYGESVLVTPA